MTRTKLSQLAMLAVLALTGAWGVLKLLARQGFHLPAVGWLQSIVIAICALLILWGGFVVRAYLNGKRPKLSGITAARIAVLAQAGSLAGALLAGWYGAQALVALENLNIESQQYRLLTAGVACVVAVGLVVCSYIAESNCQVPPTDDGMETELPDGIPG